MDRDQFRDHLSAFDKRSPAGRALQFLYGQKRDGRTLAQSIGNTYSEDNRRVLRQQHLRRLASMGDPIADAAETTRATRLPLVKVPRVGQPVVQLTAATSIPRRRTAAAIMQRQSLHVAAAGPCALPASPVLDEAEKRRLALLMQFRGELPQGMNTAQVLQQRRSSLRRGCQEEALTHMQRQLQTEIDERQEQCRRLPADDTAKLSLHHEIAARLKDMRQIHLLKYEDNT